MIEWGMDRWKYFHITHRDHLVWNPTSIEELDEIIGLLRLNAVASVLDIACGKAEMLVRMAEVYHVKRVGVDVLPLCVADPEKKRDERVPNADLVFANLDGADYRPDAPESFDLGACMGASWVFGDYRGTLRSLKAMVIPGGMVMVGEPYWLREPTREYLDAEGLELDRYATHQGNTLIGEDEGLTLLYAIVSNQDD